jgi:hypothetical protein
MSLHFEVKDIITKFYVIMKFKTCEIKGQL